MFCNSHSVVTVVTDILELQRLAKCCREVCLMSNCERGIYLSALWNSFWILQLWFFSITGSETIVNANGQIGGWQTHKAVLCVGDSCSYNMHWISQCTVTLHGSASTKGGLWMVLRRHSDPKPRLHSSRIEFSWRFSISVSYTQMFCFVVLFWHVC
jgi:hypothetical protein